MALGVFFFASIPFEELVQDCILIFPLLARCMAGIAAWSIVGAAQRTCLVQQLGQ